jgi:hypothetical protein
VNDICRNLDSIEDNLKSMVGFTKGEEGLERVEPLFKSKERAYAALNCKVREREGIKDGKVKCVQRIKEVLGQLKVIRESRLLEIEHVLEVGEAREEKFSWKEAGDFGAGFEELLKLREKEGSIEQSQREVLQELDALTQDQEAIYNELLRKQSDEVKAYHNYTKAMTQKIKYASILAIFGDEQSHLQMLSLNPSDASRKFK